ncbi:MAG: serine/threonine protein kinase, partial [Planctomycetes bacterium]|nr:serine/threonine protein kinase [Planctomycetota bacterium]
MPVNSTPDPSERPSSTRPVPVSEGSTTSRHGKPTSEVPAVPPAPAGSSAVNYQMIREAAPQVENSPTVISSARQKPLGPDAQHSEALIGRRLGHYELIEAIGMGGMATVIKAQDLDLGRIVALKILPPDMAADPENMTRFKQEARAAAKLDHENIARVYYCGEDQGLQFIAFEFVEGVNLRVSMEQHGGTLSVAEALPCMIQVTAGLSHAASRGVVHRDIKPSNIIITPEGKAKIVDMGLARNLDPKASNGQLTQSGVTLGTFDYISPEQAIEPRSADFRSDIYSLGCTFYHVLTGHAPVPEGTAAKKLHCHQHVAPLDPREWNPNIPDELAAVLARMMAKNPEQRYQHPDHLIQHLLIVAEKLNISTGPFHADAEPRISPYVDHPLPTPPGMSAIWIGLAVVGLVVGLFAFLGGFSSDKAPLDNKPFWQTEKTPREQTGAKSPTGEPHENGNMVEQPLPAKGPREARTVTELVALLKQPDVHIKLRAGTVYDLTRPIRKDADLPRALFEGSDLVIESDRLLDPPTIRVWMAPADEGRTNRPGTLTIRGPADGSTAKVRFRGIRFEFVSEDSEPSQTGVSLLNIDQVEIEDCSFIPPLKKGIPEDGPAALAITQQGTKTSTPEIRLDRCWFAPGSTAMRVTKNGAQMVRISECGFGPQHSILQVQAADDDLEPGKPVAIHLESCSILMNAGSVIQIGDRVACQVTAGWCLFSNPELAAMEPSHAYLVRQLGMISPETRFEGSHSNEAVQIPMPNGYHNVLAYANGDVSANFEACKQDLIAIEDAAARILTKHPWAEERPIKRLFDFPRQLKQILAIDLK